MKTTKLNTIALAAILFGGAVAIQVAHAAPAQQVRSLQSLPSRFYLPGDVPCKPEKNIVGRVYGMVCGSSSLFGLNVRRAPDAPVLPAGAYASGGGERVQPLQVRCNFDRQTCVGGGQVLLQIPKTAAPLVSAASAEHGRVRYVLDCDAAPVHGGLECDVSLTSNAN